MKKVGICTIYFENPNYGGILQAYAMQKIIEILGYEAEMITYYNGTRLHRLLSRIKNASIKKDTVSKKVRIRRKAVEGFALSIPHTKLYYSNTICRATNNYDCFITGSDQVWNPNWINIYTSLDFVDHRKKTIAYAASTGKVNLDPVQSEKLKRAIENTKYISIREKESIPVLQEFADRKIEYVLDPTLLFSSKDWNELCSNRIIDEDYMFCYFLRGNETLRKTALEYAKWKSIKVVSIPFMNGEYRVIDDGFGDYSLYDVSPKDFLSLIRYATFVMTDSFHAAVFSHLYEREFIVSSELDNEMGCRLKSLSELFGTEEHYIDNHEMVTLNKLIALENSKMELKWDQYRTLRQQSLTFLKEALEND